MEELTMQVKTKKIYSLKIDISQTLSRSFSINVESNVQVKKPINENEHTVFILMDSQIRTLDSEEIFGSIKAEFIIECKNNLDDKDIEDICIPLAQKELLITIDNILVEMGLKKNNV